MESIKKGVFVSYRMAEAVLMLSQYDITNPSKRKEAEEKLKALEEKWNNDEIPGYGVKIGDKIIGTKDLSLDEIKLFAEDIKKYDTYSTENAANMQYCLVRDEQGNINFNFDAFRNIAKLARQNDKKVVIDSAVVFGDCFPGNMSNMNTKEIEQAIAKYTTELTSEFGDCIVRIDVLNSVFQRATEQITKSPDGKDHIIYNEDGTEPLNSETFWIEKLGDNYGEIVLKIVKDNCKNTNIDLGWNEFYITNEKTPEKLRGFIETIANLSDLNVVGLQDAFRADTSCEYIQSTLEKMANLCEKLGKKMCITELSCRLGKDDIESLNSVKHSEKYADKVEEINKRIAKVLKTVTDVAEKKSDVISSVEARYSDRYDFNHEQIIKKHGHDIQTSLKRDNYFEQVPQTNDFVATLQSQVVTDDAEYAKNIENITTNLENENPSKKINKEEI